MYTIGRLAQRAKVNADSIRFYERQGLLSPAQKTHSGYRLYTDEAVQRIAFVKRAQQCGFSLAEIRELLQIRSDDPSARGNGYSVAAQKHAEIQKTLEALHAMSEALATLLESRADGAAHDSGDVEQNALYATVGGSQSLDGTAGHLRHSAETP